MISYFQTQKLWKEISNQILQKEENSEEPAKQVQCIHQGTYI